MKNLGISLLLIVLGLQTSAQTLSLQRCLDAVVEYYPLSRQKALDSQILVRQEGNIRAERAPQVALNAQATYQSDVTSLPIEFPGIDIPTISRDQYKITADVNYLLYDGGVTATRLALERLATLRKNKQVDAEILKVQEQVLGAYFRAILLEKNIAILESQRKVLAARAAKVKAMVENGVAMRNQADIIKLESLRLEQQTAEAEAEKAKSLTTLALLTGLEVNDEASLELPGPMNLPNPDFSNRPEYSLLASQQAGLELQDQLNNNLARPRASLFGQGGYGRPALNFLDNDFAAFYIGGIRLSWNLSSRYSLNRKQEINRLSHQVVDLQREALDTRLQTLYDRQTTEIDKLENLLERDREMIRLTEGVTKAYAARLDNGVITSDTYTTQLNHETQAKLKQALHETQLLMAFYTVKMLTGR